MLHWLRQLLLAFMAASLLMAGWLTWSWLDRPGMQAVAKHQLNTDDPGAKLNFTWFGVSTVLISDGQHSVLTDAFISRPEGLWPLLSNAKIEPDAEMIARQLRLAGVEKINAIAVGHSHYDHSMDAAAIAQQTGASIIGSASTLNVGRGGGIEEARLVLAETGVSHAFGAFKVTFFPSQHSGLTGGIPTGSIDQPLIPPAHYQDYKEGSTYSILIEHPAGNVLYHGGAGVEPGALEDVKADVVLLGIAARPALEQYLRAVVDQVGAHTVIPVHWDDFTQGLNKALVPLPIAVSLDEFFINIRSARPQLRVITLPIATPRKILL